ncbi:CaiB/BaiF CoA-transferase family protein [Pseudonocardia ailaonensis]|uniref:CaiB/BaiF CoA-transferase family protein n=1 Tax=Pseudonocardia ailaonensis TaxID=367279 RepID=A0ABN2N143_9PSEU
MIAADPGFGRGALRGIRVLDLSRFIAGPFCAMLLGDMGADVVKIEGPGGEPGRWTGPTYDGESIYTSWFNRNKRAMTLDMRGAPGLGVLRELIASADVLVENFRPGTLAKMGLTAEVLDDLNPALVVVSVSGFGQSGPRRDQVAFDSIAQALSGLMWATGTDGTGPHMVGTFVADHVTGLYAALGALTALYEKQRSGIGQSVDVALLDATFSIMGVAVPALAATGESMARVGNRDQMVSPSGLFEAADGHAYISAGNDIMFGRLVTATGIEALRDPGFRTLSGRLRRSAELEELVQRWTASRTLEELGAVFGAAGIPFGPVATIADAMADPQIRHRDMVSRTVAEDGTRFVVPGHVARLSRSTAATRLPPPKLGEHNEPVLAEWTGASAERIASLTAEGAFGEARTGTAVEVAE